MIFHCVVLDEYIISCIVYTFWAYDSQEMLVYLFWKIWHEVISVQINIFFIFVVMINEEIWSIDRHFPLNEDSNFWDIPCALSVISSSTRVHRLVLWGIVMMTSLIYSAHFNISGLNTWKMKKIFCYFNKWSVYQLPKYNGQC